MRTRQFLLVILFIAGTFFQMQAQVAEDSVVHRNITIEREYQPVIQDAGKLNILPNFLEPQVVRLTPKYTDFNLPLAVGQNIHYLSAADLTYQKNPERQGIARLGLGTGFNSVADFAFPLVNKEDMKLDFILNHYGLFNSKAHSTTQAALLFDKKFNAFDFYAGLGGSHEYFKYYGSTFNRTGIVNLGEVANAFQMDYKPLYNMQSGITLDSLANMPRQNNLWRFNVNTGIRTSPVTDEFRYGAHLNYNLFSAMSGITEHELDLRLKFDMPLFEEDRLGIQFSSQNMLYSARTNDLSAALKNYYVLFVNPYYDIIRPEWDLHLGVKSSFSLAHGRKFSPSPDVRFEWRAIPNLLAIYAGAGGGYQVNTMDKMYQENCFLNPDVMVDGTYTPVDFYAGVILKPVSGLLIDVFVDYQMIKDQYFFVNKTYQHDQYFIPSGFNTDDLTLYSNRFEAVYSDAQLLKVGGRVSYSHHDRFSVQLKGAYNHWNVKSFEYAWNKPAWELDLNANVQVIRGLNVYGNMYFAGKRYAMLDGLAPVKMSGMANINLGASYALMDWMSVFLRFNNLINNKYEQWYGYEVQGFNVMAGVSFNF